MEKGDEGGGRRGRGGCMWQFSGMRRGKSGIYRTRIKAKRREGRGGEGLFLFRGVRRALISAFSTRTAMLEGFLR